MEANREIPVPANSACGIVVPNATIGILVTLVENRETFKKLSTSHFIRELLSAFLKLLWMQIDIYGNL